MKVFLFAVVILGAHPALANDNTLQWQDGAKQSRLAAIAAKAFEWSLPTKATKLPGYDKAQRWAEEYFAEGAKGTREPEAGVKVSSSGDPVRVSIRDGKRQTDFVFLKESGKLRLYYANADKRTGIFRPRTLRAFFPQGERFKGITIHPRKSFVARTKQRLTNWWNHQKQRFSRPRPSKK